MTVGEANAVNVLCRHILGAPAHAGHDSGPPTEDQVRAALEHLAQRAHRALHAGYHEGSVQRLWPSMPRSP